MSVHACGDVTVCVSCLNSVQLVLSIVATVSIPVSPQCIEPDKASCHKAQSAQYCFFNMAMSSL